MEIRHREQMNEFIDPQDYYSPWELYETYIPAKPKPKTAPPPVKVHIPEFEDIKEKTRDAKKTAKAHYKVKQFDQAIKIYLKAVQALKTFEVKNVMDRKELQELLIQLYKNLAICSIDSNFPLKACEMVNELTKIENNAEIMFLLGRALLELNDFPKAQNALCVALKLDPKNPTIIKMLEILEKRATMYYDSEKEKIVKNIKAAKQSVVQGKVKQTEVDVDGLKIRESDKKNLMKFKENKTKKLGFPASPNTFSLKVKSLTDELGMKLNIDSSKNLK